MLSHHLPDDLHRLLTLDDSPEALPDHHVEQLLGPEAAIGGGPRDGAGGRGGLGLGNRGQDLLQAGKGTGQSVKADRNSINFSRSQFLLPVLVPVLEHGLVGLGRRRGGHPRSGGEDGRQQPRGRSRQRGRGPRRGRGRRRGPRTSRARVQKGLDSNEIWPKIREN